MPLVVRCIASLLVSWACTGRSRRVQSSRHPVVAFVTPGPATRWPAPTTSLVPRASASLLRAATDDLALVDEDVDLASSTSKESRVEEVQAWVDSRIVRHGLCPWAGRAARTNDIKVIVPEAQDQEELFKTLAREVSMLVNMEAPGLATTLVGCTSTWAQDFGRFDDFVQKAGKQFMGEVSLVCFHPDFNRWHHLDVKAGDHVLSYFRESYYDPEEVEAAQRRADETGENVEVPCVYSRSETPDPGVVLSTDEDDLGVRSVLVQFEDGDECSVPLDWIVLEDDDRTKHGVPLADNLLHCSPLPVVHILHGERLNEESTAAGDEAIDGLQRRNACLLRRAVQIFKKRVLNK